MTATNKRFGDARVDHVGRDSQDLSTVEELAAWIASRVSIGASA